MTTLTFNLDEEVTGSATGCDEMDDIEICAEVTVDGDCVGTIDWTHTPEILDEVTVHVMTDFDLSPSDLDGTNEERIQFAADMTAEVIRSLTAERDLARERLGEAKHWTSEIHNLKVEAGEMKERMAAVWPAVVEAFDSLTAGPFDERAAAGAARDAAGAKVMDALRTLGLEPEPESKTDTES